MISNVYVDIFCDHRPVYRLAQRSHLSLGQIKVMSAIEECRTAALWGTFPLSARLSRRMTLPHWAQKVHKSGLVMSMRFDTS